LRSKGIFASDRILFFYFNAMSIDIGLSTIARAGFIIFSFNLPAVARSLAI